MLALTAVGVALLVAAGTGVPWLISKTGGDSSSSGHGYRLGEAMTTVTLSHDQPIDSAGLSPDGRWAVTYDHKAEEVDADTATVWNAWTGARIGTLQTDGITFSPDGTRIANVYFTGQRSTETVNGQKMGLLSGGDTVVDLLRTEDLSKIATFAGHLGSADVAFSPDSSLVATADTRASEKDFAARIRLWKTDGGSLVSTLTGHANGIQSMEFSHDGRTLVSSAAGGVTKIWDVATGRASATLSNAWFPEWLSPAGEVLVTRTAKGFEVRRLPGGAVVATVTNAGSFVGFSPDGSAYATSSGTTVRLYRTASRQLLQTLEGKVKAPIVASPDGRLIAALADDGTPMLWDPATGKVVASLVGHQQTVTDLVFATDGQVLMTVGVDKTVRRWYANSSLLPAPSGSASAAPTGSAG